MFDGRDFLEALDAQLKKAGGCSLGALKPGQITFDAQAPDKRELESLVESYCEHFRKAQCQVHITVEENPEIPVAKLEMASEVSLVTAVSKLTKSFLMSLETGAFLASEVTLSGFEPVFAERVSESQMRPAQWAKIRSIGAHQKGCRIFSSESHFRIWLDDCRAYFASRKS